MQLQAFIDRLNNLERLTSEVKSELAKESAKLIQQGFDKQKDPYEMKWAGLKVYRPGKILQKTGRLKDSFYSYETSYGVRIQSQVNYANYHQTGTNKMVARPMVPFGTFGQKWRDSFEKVFNKTVLRCLLGR